MERIVDIDLITITYSQDEIGQEVEEETTTATVCGTQSGITRQEWSIAAQNGLNPEGVVKLSDEADYNGEEVLAIDDVRYSIYRTFPTNDGGIELYYRKKIGDNL